MTRIDIRFVLLLLLLLQCSVPAEEPNMLSNSVFTLVMGRFTSDDTVKVEVFATNSGGKCVVTCKALSKERCYSINIDNDKFAQFFNDVHLFGPTLLRDRFEQSESINTDIPYLQVDFRHESQSFKLITHPSVSPGVGEFTKWLLVQSVVGQGLRSVPVEQQSPEPQWLLKYALGSTARGEAGR